MNPIWSASHMAVFAKVVELNGFSAAARAYKVPKAAISRAVSALESELGVALLTRTTRRIYLTAAGSQLLSDCQRIVGAVNDVRARAAHLTTERAGPLRVLAEPSLGRILLTPLVPRFLERFPGIMLEIALGAIDDDVQAAHWDVAVRVGAASGAEQLTRELGTPPALLCATPAYLHKHGMPRRPEELDGHALLLPESAGAAATLLLTQGNRRAEVTVHPKLAVSDPALLQGAVLSGLGIALLPEFLCRQGIATRKLERVLADWQLPEQAPLCAVYPARLATDERVVGWLDFLSANIVPALAGQ